MRHASLTRQRTAFRTHQRHRSVSFPPINTHFHIHIFQNRFKTRTLFFFVRFNGDSTLRLQLCFFFCFYFVMISILFVKCLYFILFFRCCCGCCIRVVLRMEEKKFHRVWKKRLMTMIKTVQSLEVHLKHALDIK